MVKLLRFIILFFIVLSLNKSVFAEDNIIKTNVGEKIKIELDSNPTTGFQWQLQNHYDENLLVLLSSYYIASNPKLMGSGGKEVWIFKAIKKGNIMLVFDYIRPWESVEPEVQKIYNLEIK